MAESFSPEEADNLLKTFLAMGVKPKASSKEDLEKWMKDYFTTKEELHPSQEHLPALSRDKPREDIKMLPALPKVSFFSGDPASKSEVSFDVWKFEVEELVQSSYNKEQIRQAIFKSLRGEAGKIVMRLGHRVELDRLLKKLNSVFGRVEETQDLLAEFYSTVQTPKESVAEWGCRLEDILQKAVDRGDVSQDAINDMLRTRFWSGLTASIKQQTAHKYDRIKDYEELMVEVRKIESEVYLSSSEKKRPSASHHIKAVTEDNEMKNLIASLTQTVQALQKDVKDLKNNRPDQSNSRQEHEEPTCFRCGQKGLIRTGCRVRLNKDLNCKKFLSKGRQ
ncbi:uncharacterized protein LOC130010771 [Patella vulgata]|uniref:uncharacterized protein LOC130010771 n=1 Tax=Patella vulgata TaxID=6465 RepID=UPI0024A82F59|nr:uncharacterized protein LOC130010771 [Patella vulgata]